jgi:hypothetical protein
MVSVSVFPEYLSLEQDVLTDTSEMIISTIAARVCFLKITSFSHFLWIMPTADGLTLIKASISCGIKRAGSVRSETGKHLRGNKSSDHGTNGLS